jgi:hypothetical protein
MVSCRMLGALLPARGCFSSRGMRIIGEVILRATMVGDLEPSSMSILPQDIEHELDAA